MYKTPKRNTHRGMTLVELLVVLTILVILVGVTIPLISSVAEDRPTQEGARVLASQMAKAQSRAMANGRDVALILVRDRLSGVDNLDAMNTVYQLAIAESPPPYSGDSTDTMCFVTLPTNPAYPHAIATFDNTTTRPLCDGDTDLYDDDFIRPGDVIRFAFREPDHTIIAVDQNSVQFVPPPRFPSATPVPFQIIRAPRRTSDPAVSLPPEAYIDLRRTFIVPQVATLNPLDAINHGQSPADPNDALPAFRPFEYYGMANVQWQESGDVQLIFDATGRLDRIRGFNRAGMATADQVRHGEAYPITRSALSETLLKLLPAKLLDPITVTIRGGAPLAPKQSFQFVEVGPRQAAHVTPSPRGLVPTGSSVPAALSLGGHSGGFGHTTGRGGY